MDPEPPSKHPRIIKKTISKTAILLKINQIERFEPRDLSHEKERDKNMPKVEIGSFLGLLGVELWPNYSFETRIWQFSSISPKDLNRFFPLDPAMPTYWLANHAGPCDAHLLVGKSRWTLNV